MGLRTYLKDKKKRALSKCIYLQEKVASRFHRLQDKAVSRLQSQKRHIPESLLSPIKEEESEQPSLDSILEDGLIFQAHEKISIFSEAEVEERTVDEKFTWSAQVPEGARVVKIVVMKGEILEKTYLTKEGERILVKLDELLKL
ncbi:hypothetical protein [Prochlorococcus sp. MIT 1307]|uniref:hypothetical protein n=1 Tax=Prochlorococcus sp. MIT 1307 TaxID=3096219 RepID=UPI002A7581E2|nr:hypothetical protein [Prochlorococcus sp. MIT 1307]